MTHMVITGVFGGLALIIVILRLYTRFPPFKAKLDWDDGLIIAAIVYLSRSPSNSSASELTIPDSHDGYVCVPVYQ